MHELREWFAGERGRQSMLADRLGVTPGAITQWRRVPINHVALVSKITGIPREVLRPDVFEERDDER